MGVAPAPQEQRRGSGSTVLVAGLAVALAIGLVTWLVAGHRSHAPQPASLAGTGAPTVAPAPVQHVSHAVSYELSGGQALNITYVAQGAQIAQVAEATTPWSVSIDDETVAGSTPFYSVSAQNAGDGTMSCRIVLDGAVVSEASVTGSQDVVRCSKSLG